MQYSRFLFPFQWLAQRYMAWSIKEEMNQNGNLRCTCIMTRSCNKWKYWSKTCTTYSMTVKKFAYCIKAKNQTKRKPSHSRKWLSGLRYSGSFLKISLHVQYSKKKKFWLKKKINHESRLCYKVHIFLEEF